MREKGERERYTRYEGKKLSFKYKGTFVILKYLIKTNQLQKENCKIV